MSVAKLLAAAFVVAVTTVPTAVAAPKRAVRSLPPPPRPVPDLLFRPTTWACEGWYSRGRVSPQTDDSDGLEVQIVSRELYVLRVWKGAHESAKIGPISSTGRDIRTTIALPSLGARPIPVTLTCVGGRVRVEGRQLGGQWLTPKVDQWDVLHAPASPMIPRGYFQDR